MTFFLKRIFQIVSLGSLTFAACKVAYGMPADVDYYKAVKVQTEEIIPIKGLSVKLILNSDTMSAEYTDSNGVVPLNYEFYFGETYSVLIDDFDGEENSGNFISKKTSFTEPDTTIVTMKLVEQQ